MIIEEIIKALSCYDSSKMVIIRLGDSLNVDEIPLGGFSEVSYCECWEEIIGDDYKVDPIAERKRCDQCRMAKVELCARTDGIGQYMLHALLVDGGEKREGVPSFGKEYAKVMTERGFNYVSGLPLKEKKKQ